MKCWVVSPNIDRGLGAKKLEKWKRFVLDCEAVFMGWSPDQEKDGSKGLGVKFATEVKKGDVILSAYRHSRRWEVLGCGKVRDDKPRADLKLERGFHYGSYRRLEPFVRLSPNPKVSNLVLTGTAPDELYVIPTIVELDPNRNRADQRLRDRLVSLIARTGEIFARQPLDPEDEENLDLLNQKSYKEGKRRFVLHRSLERSRQLVKDAKAYHSKKHGGRMECEVCTVDFEREYGERGKGFIEAHHRIPIARARKNSKPKVEDLAMVCGNCHRMLHRPPWVSVEQLRSQWKKLHVAEK